MRHEVLVQEPEHRIVLGEALIRSEREVVVDEGGVDSCVERCDASRTSSASFFGLESVERQLHGIDGHRRNEV